MFVPIAVLLNETEMEKGEEVGQLEKLVLLLLEGFSHSATSIDGNEFRFV